jgi:hypothetical protein
VRERDDHLFKKRLVELQQSFRVRSDLQGSDRQEETNVDFHDPHVFGLASARA